VQVTAPGTIWGVDIAVGGTTVMEIHEILDTRTAVVRDSMEILMAILLEP
jgi:hypothetical protein